MFLKILVIDDDQEILNLIEIILKEEGHTVFVSTDGAILKTVDKLKPDLILLDMVLGHERGTDLCIELKEDPATAHIPVVFLSALTSIGDMAEKAGVFAYLRKPFDIYELLDMVEAVGKRVS